MWLLLTRSLKLLPHLYRHPKDIVFVPLWLLFGYYFAVMKLYALVTLHKTEWGTRQSVKDPTSATIADEARRGDDAETEAFAALATDKGLANGHAWPAPDTPDGRTATLTDLVEPIPVATTAYASGAGERRRLGHARQATDEYEYDFTPAHPLEQPGPHRVY